MVQFFENSGLFLARDTTQGLKFQVWPENITDTKSVNWADIQIIGRSEPLKVYASSSARVFGFTLYFVASVDAADRGSAELVKSRVNWCQSLAYPETLPSGIIAFPPVVILIIGDLIRSRCVVKQVATNYTGPWVYDQRTKQVLRANAVNTNPGFSETQIGGPGRISITEEVPEGPPYPSLPIYASVALQFEEVNVIPHESQFVRANRRDQSTAVLPVSFPVRRSSRR